MARTKLGLNNLRVSALGNSVDVGALQHTIVTADVTNKIVFCDFFEAVEDTAFLVITNPDATNSVNITIETGPNLAGNADGTGVTQTAFDTVYAIAAGKTKIIPITNSSMFGQPNTDAAGAKGMGLYVTPGTGADTYALTIGAYGKYPASYSGATLS